MVYISEKNLFLVERLSGLVGVCDMTHVCVLFMDIMLQSHGLCKQDFFFILLSIGDLPESDLCHSTFLSVMTKLK